MTPNAPGKQIPSHGTDQLAETSAYDFLQVDWSRTGHPFYDASVVHFADLDSVLHQEGDPVSGGVQFDEPHVLVPDTPGHGADLEPAYLETLEGICIRA